jgi:hypothetical protein
MIAGYGEDQNQMSKLQVQLNIKTAKIKVFAFRHWSLIWHLNFAI